MESIDSSASSDSSDSYTYVGFARHDKYIFTVEFNKKKPIENMNGHFEVKKFKILQIEDNSGNLFRKIPQYCINAKYYLRRHPLIVFPIRNNLDFHEFYMNRKEDYLKYTGSVTEYYKDGNICCRYFMNDGKLNGLLESFYENGKIYETGYFIDDIRHGLTTFNNYYYEITCNFNMDNPTDWNIKLLEPKICHIIENLYNLAYDRYEETTTYNIDTDRYVGTVNYVNSKLTDWNVNVKDSEAIEILKDKFMKIPNAMCKKYNVYNYQ